MTRTIAMVRGDGRILGELHAADFIGTALCKAVLVGAIRGSTVVGFVDREQARTVRGQRPEPCAACLASAPKAWRRWFRRTGRVGRPPIHPRARLRNDYLNGALPEQRDAGAPAPAHRWCTNCVRTGRIRVQKDGPDARCARCNGRGIITIHSRRIPA